MSPGATLAAASISVAVSVSAMAMLGIRMNTGDRSRATAGVRLPPAISLCHWPALLIAPLVSGLMPATYENRVLQVLDSNDLHPRLTPVLWVATRVVHGVVAAGIAFLCSGSSAWLVASLSAATAFMAGGWWLRRRNHDREKRIARELPAYLDLLTVCVEAGATLTAGVRLIVAQAPDSPLRCYFERVLREVRGGRPRAQAFAHVAAVHGVESLTTLANALAHAEAAGMSLGQILRTQSAQRTAERFARAERLAMQAPVKMLGPLILCIFPCTFVVLAVPIAVRLLEVFRS